MRSIAEFTDRYDAGDRLGRALAPYATERPLIVLGLPRGGVPVAARVAEALDAPLDLFIVRKLGAPDYEELALGAIASGGARVYNRDLIVHLGVPLRTLEAIELSERRELQRREADYREGRPFPPLVDETVIVVDDGAATGASMRVAIHALRQLHPRTIVAAVPVASRDAVELLQQEADACVSIITPHPFYGVGTWYRDFSQTSDAEVRQLLADAHRRWDGSRLTHAER